MEEWRPVPFTHPLQSPHSVPSNPTTPAPRRALQHVSPCAMRANPSTAPRSSSPCSSAGRLSKCWWEAECCLSNRAENLSFRIPPFRVGVSDRRTIVRWKTGDRRARIAVWSTRSTELNQEPAAGVTMVLLRCAGGGGSCSAPPLGRRAGVANAEQFRVSQGDKDRWVERRAQRCGACLFASRVPLMRIAGDAH